VREIDRYDKYSDEELENFLRSHTSDILYQGAVFEWNRRQEIKKVRREKQALRIGLLTLGVLLVSAVIQYCAGSKLPNLRPFASKTEPSIVPAAPSSPSPSPSMMPSVEPQPESTQNQ
jgi:hypothetical protein